MQKVLGNLILLIYKIATLKLFTSKFSSEKQSVILQSEALRSEKINHALGEAESMRLQAEARAAAIEKIAEAITANVSYLLSEMFARVPSV